MEALDPNDYLISQDGIDWKAVLLPWEPVLPSSFTIWVVNRFGDLFLECEDGSLMHFDVQLGTVTKKADNKKQFLELLAEDNNAEDWLYMTHVDQAVAAGITLPEGHCYTFKQPPVLSGEYNLANLGTISLETHYAFLASIHAQIKGVPDGSSILLNPSE